MLDRLWDTLSSCLLELADTPDHHAVLVLQVCDYISHSHMSLSDPGTVPLWICYFQFPP
jgi:hypothetical protein